MQNKKISDVPPAYLHAVQNEYQGSVSEVSYQAVNYINQARQLVTFHNINSVEAGRKTIRDKAITKKCNVYLPAGYNKNDTATKYNVLYLLHGVGGNRLEWLSGNGEADGNFVICNILDNLIVNGDIDPLIVVFPDGRSAYDWTDISFNPDGTNLLGFYYFDYELRYDLIPFIETNFNTYANIDSHSPEDITHNRLHRAIAGLSMGGMQALNLIVGGYRCDSIRFTNTSSRWDNGLDFTVPAPGMLDLFAYIGAFSNAPTSSEGHILGSSIAASKHKLNLLYMTCGDADEIAYQAGYQQSIADIAENAGMNLSQFIKTPINGGIHNFDVWNYGAYNFIRLFN